MTQCWKISVASEDYIKNWYGERTVNPNNNKQSVTAQNYTTNAINAVGSASTSINQTTSELGQNMSNAVGNAPEPANQTAERGENVSIARTNTSTALNKT
ncbi:MAG TPA: hypothetical protein VNB68_00770, partial [Nitrososphaeraceae archaeon]|nr:hypothetical protein [Nitrososphaeraceae archaeon]